MKGTAVNLAGETSLISLAALYQVATGVVATTPDPGILLLRALHWWQFSSPPPRGGPDPGAQNMWSSGLPWIAAPA